jgi:peptidoglycan/LPS O-acetylase OafA/YrhL
LRLVAAVMVVLYHYIAQGDNAWQRESRTLFGVADTVTSYGWLGVELFFVISGFVICMSAWGKPVGDFLVSRTVRLYPAYWFAIIAITVAVSLFPVLQNRMVSTEILVNLTMFQYPVKVPGVSSVFWSLWEELHFYLLFCLVVWRGTTYSRVVAFCGIWTVASVFAEAINLPALNWLVGQGYSPYFIGGITIYLMYRFRPNLLLWGLLGISWVLALLRSVQQVKDARDFGGHELAWRPAAVVITGAFLAVAAATLWPRLSRIQSRWLTVAGALTYPLYLLHLEIGWLLIRQLHGAFPAWPLVISLTAGMLLLSYAVNRWIERPVSGRMRRLLRGALADLRDPAAVERVPGAGAAGRPSAQPREQAGQALPTPARSSSARPEGSETLVGSGSR